MSDFDHDCGSGCACNNCGGCIRAGTRCKIFPKPRAGFEGDQAGVAKALRPLTRRLGMDELVTINVTALTLAEAGLLVSTMLSDPIAVPADKALKPVRIRMRDVPLSQVVDKLGLIVR